VDLSPFYETTATLSPILLAGTALAYSARTPPRTVLGNLAFGSFVLVPPLIATWYSLQVLAGFASAETWRLPVLVLLGLQLLTGLSGTGGFVRTDKEDAALIRQRRRERRERQREERRKRHQPHSQPHKPAPTGPHPMQPATGDGGAEQAKRDGGPPAATPAGHS
jgi:hypothetical protein